MVTRASAKRVAMSETVKVGYSGGSPGMVNVQNGNGYSATEEILPHGLGKKRFITIPEAAPGAVPVTTKNGTKPRTKSPSKPKKHKYGLTPGFSPFPDQIIPTIEQCKEVHDLLTKRHGVFEPPKVIPPPSASVTGCGEVPDLLDALLRTLLSQHTTFENAAVALKGLINAFGSVLDSPNWDVVRQSDLEDVIESIKRGGLQKMKGTAIKNILDTVYSQNLERQKALLKEKSTGKPADVAGANHESQEQKDTEIARTKATLLSLDYIFNLSNDEAMNELVKLDGIGVKTASCVMLFCMQRPSFAVDTHVQRHCKWLGWVPENSKENQTFSHLEVRVPDHLKYGLHQLFIHHGKECLRCSASTNSTTKGWEQVVCPIEHLVKRFGKKKDFLDRDAKIKNPKLSEGEAIEDEDGDDESLKDEDVKDKDVKDKDVKDKDVKDKDVKDEVVKDEDMEDGIMNFNATNGKTTRGKFTNGKTPKNKASGGKAMKSKASKDKVAGGRVTKGRATNGKATKGNGRKGKKNYDETEESDVEMSDKLTEDDD